MNENKNPFTPFIYELANIQFHIKRLSYSRLQEANDTTEPFKAKLAVLESCISKIQFNSNLEPINNVTGDLLRTILTLDQFMDLCDICFYAQTLNDEQYLWLKMSAWNNTKELDNAMQVPCGCALVHQAETMSDRVAAEVLREEAPDFQKQWACKATCKAGEVPTPKALSSIIPLSNLTKVPVNRLEKALDTCPKFVLSQPWINDAIQYYNWRDKGQLNVLFSNPEAFKGTHKEAIDTIANGIRTYEQYHQDKLEKSREENK